MKNQKPITTKTLTDKEKLKFNYIANRLLEIDYQDVIFDNNKLSKIHLKEN